MRWSTHTHTCVCILYELQDQTINLPKYIVQVQNNSNKSFRRKGIFGKYCSPTVSLPIHHTFHSIWIYASRIISAECRIFSFDAWKVYAFQEMLRPLGYMIRYGSQYKIMAATLSFQFQFRFHFCFLENVSHRHIVPLSWLTSRILSNRSYKCGDRDGFLLLLRAIVSICMTISWNDEIRFKLRKIRLDAYKADDYWLLCDCLQIPRWFSLV